MKNEYPAARYNRKTGAMLIVMSPDEDAVLGSQWGSKALGVRYPKNPPKPELPKITAPIFSIKLPRME